MSRKIVFNAQLGQAPLYCVTPSQPLIISTQHQPNTLTPTPVYLYNAPGAPTSGSNATFRPQYFQTLSNSSNLVRMRSSRSKQRENLRRTFPHYGGNNIVMGNALESTSEAQCDTKKLKGERRKRVRPWRGYILEGEENERIFQSVALNGYYAQETISDAVSAINISTATDKLRRLHRKFAEHRKTIDDGRPLEARDAIDPMIPFNEGKQNESKCECSEEQKKSGIHHHIYPKQPIPRCDVLSNNADMLYHYRLVIKPDTNFVTRDPSTIYYDGKDFCFEGYSLFSHNPIDDIPHYSFMRGFIDYEVSFVRIKYIPEGFCIKDLDLVSDYFFKDIMELHEWKTPKEKNGCRRFHFMPRFVHRTTDLTVTGNRELSEILSMAEVLQHLIDACAPFADRHQMKTFVDEDWKEFVSEKSGSLICNSKNKPRTIRVDDVKPLIAGQAYPDIVHLTPKYPHDKRIDMKEFANICNKLSKVKRAIRSRAVPRREDQKLAISLSEKLEKLKKIRGATKWVDLSFTSRKYRNTGLRWDACQHASYIPALANYLRIMMSTSILERNINYKFKDKSLLKVAITHPSFLDTASFSYFIWNMLQNCGKQYPHMESERKREKKVGAKKKGMIYMTNIMATMLSEEETPSSCHHNERLEFLGDALLDYIISLHLFLMFPQKGQGKLTSFRSGIVQTEHLSDLAKKIHLEQYILMQHRVAEISKTENYLGNCLEAVIGAVYLDGGLIAVENLLSFLLFIDDADLCKIWNNLKKHPLQEEHPISDRHLIAKHDILKNFVKLENTIGVEFKHIRLLAKAFTHTSQALNDEKLTGGNNERMEFLGDAILKYVSSDYLYKHFPIHSEGHLTLLRTTLVNYRCLSKAALELGLNNFILFQYQRIYHQMKEKVCSDVFEALLGALHIEKGVKEGIKYCYKLIEVCILSRLQEFIVNQEWLDPKSQLQQCCQSLRDPADPIKDGKDHFHPVYKKLETKCEDGIHYFKVAVYVNDKQIGVGEGRSRKVAEKNAATEALSNNYFEQWAIQKRIAYKKFGTKDYRFKGDEESDSDDDADADAIKALRENYDSDDDDDREEDDGQYNSDDDDDGQKNGVFDEEENQISEEESRSSDCTLDNRGKSSINARKRLKHHSLMLRKGSVGETETRQRLSSGDSPDSSPKRKKRKDGESKEVTPDRTPCVPERTKPNNIGLNLEKWIAHKNKNNEDNDLHISTDEAISLLDFLNEVEAISSPENVEDDYTLNPLDEVGEPSCSTSYVADIETISSPETNFEPVSSPENVLNVDFENVTEMENETAEERSPGSAAEECLPGNATEECSPGSEDDGSCGEEQPEGSESEEQTSSGEGFVVVDAWEGSDDDGSLSEVKLY